MKDQRAFAEQLFGEALDLPREQRATFLAEACRDTPAVRHLVEALLEENDRLSGFLSQPPYKKAKETASHLLAPGARLGRYTIVGQLGAGGMGIVYRARDEKLEREVAIKMVSKGVLASEEARRHFRREALALAKLNHAHIAAVYDVGEQDGADFLVMELVQGQSLAAKLRLGPLQVNEATAIARQVAEALGEAHEHGVIHRDLKPANVMITPKGDAKVLDFGLAKLLASDVGATTMSVAETRGILGTPVYMSPEQALGKGVDARTDLWSLGVLYYESLAGRPPFAGNSSLDVLHAITGAPVPSIRAIRPEVPPLAEHIVTRALEKDCDLRYQRAVEMETDLKRLTRDLDPGRVSVSSVSVTDEKIAQARRARGRAAMLAGVAGLVLVLALAYVLRPTVPPPHVIGIKQITHDATTKLAPGNLTSLPIFTDGMRVYFTALDSPQFRLMQVSASGGESVPVPIPMALEGFAGMSPPKSELLLLGPPQNTATGAGGVWAMPALGGQVRRIGDFTAYDATWSPDGSSLYYSLGSDIWVARSDGSHARKILTTNGTPYWIRFSPDGLLIRFSVLDESANTNGLWQAQTDGSQVTRLLSGDAWSNECCGVWISNGEYFVFQSMRGTSSTLWAMREKREWWRKTNTGPVRLTTGEMISEYPLASEDEKNLFFVGATRRGELVRFDLQKRSFVQYLTGLSAEAVAFSKDGSRIAYVTLPEGNIWQSKSDGSDRHQLTFPPMEVGQPRWSPDGKKIAFEGGEPGRVRKIYIISAEGGNPEQVTQSDKDDIDPSWSPNGDSIVFGGSYQLVTTSKQHPIQILNLKNSELTTLADSGRYFSPRWSPDGRTIAAIEGDSGALALYDFAKQNWEKLTSIKSAFPIWSQDGRCIYFSDLSDTKLPEYRLCLSDRKPRVVANMAEAGPIVLGNFWQWTGVSPDGSILATRDISLEEIYSVELDLP
jgi:eukaryotic-like serine/threonine-protein kinase